MTAALQATDLALAHALRGDGLPAPHSQSLQAGSLTARLYGSHLCDVRWRGRPTVQRIFVAVRDERWGTVEPQIHQLTVHGDDDEFVVQLDVEHNEADIRVRWNGLIRASADGRLSFGFEAEALTEFPYNRIGLCVLHDAAQAAGRPYIATTPAGPLSGTLPELVGPQAVLDGQLVPTIPACHALTLDLGDGVRSDFQFVGALFETEDQRNWTDASFKTYCTPIAEPYPLRANRGLRIRQAVSARLSGPVQGESDEQTKVQIAGRLGPWPRIGIAISLGAPSPEARSLIGVMRPAHLRVKVDLNDPTARERFVDLMECCADLNVGVELAVSEGTERASRTDAVALADDAARLGVPLSRILVFAGDAGFELRLTAMRRRFPSVEVGVTTREHFAELNRSWPDPDSLDCVGFAFSPAVHASDDLSLMENVRAQADVVRAARVIAGGKSVAAGPMRFAPGDPRASALFGAAWTVASLGEMARSGCDSVTSFSLADDVLLRDARPTPAALVLCELPTTSAARLACIANGPLGVVAWCDEGSSQALIANLDDSEQRVAVTGLGPAPMARIMDATAVAHGIDRISELPSAPVSDPTGNAVALPPYAVAHVAATEAIAS